MSAVTVSLPYERARALVQLVWDPREVRCHHHVASDGEVERVVITFVSPIIQWSNCQPAAGAGVSVT